jgi:hypothetical protein
LEKTVALGISHILSNILKSETWSGLNIAHFSIT